MRFVVGFAAFVLPSVIVMTGAFQPEASGLITSAVDQIARVLMG